MVRILTKYPQASGQIINLDKSTMTFSPGMQPKARADVQAVLGIQVVDKFEKYLGMPAVVGRLKYEVFSFLKDQVWDRIKRWNERDFSMAGREGLIKAVLQAIPTYVMSAFYYLLRCSRRLKRLCGNIDRELVERGVCIGCLGLH